MPINIVNRTVATMVPYHIFLILYPHLPLPFYCVQNINLQVYLQCKPVDCTLQLQCRQPQTHTGTKLRPVNWQMILEIIRGHSETI